jgi:hypothetical protein
MQWESFLPPHLSIPRSVAIDLEGIRASIECPDDVFAIRVVGSAWATRRTQEFIYAKLRNQHPHASQSELLKKVYETRKLTSIMAGQELPALPTSCRTLQALIDFFVLEEARHAMPDPLGLGARIDSILARAAYES